MILINITGLQKFCQLFLLKPVIL